MMGNKVFGIISSNGKPVIASDRLPLDLLGESESGDETNDFWPKEPIGDELFVETTVGELYCGNRRSVIAINLTGAGYDLDQIVLVAQQGRHIVVRVGNREYVTYAGKIGYRRLRPTS